MSCVVPENFVANFQQQLVDIQLDCTRADAPLHNLSREIICTVQCYQNSFVDLLINGLEAIKMDLPFCGAQWPVVAMNVADGGCEDVNTDGNKFVDVFWGREKC